MAKNKITLTIRTHSELIKVAKILCEQEFGKVDTTLIEKTFPNLAFGMGFGKISYQAAKLESTRRVTSRYDVALDAVVERAGEVNASSLKVPANTIGKAAEKILSESYGASWKKVISQSDVDTAYAQAEKMFTEIRIGDGWKLEDFQKTSKGKLKADFVSNVSTARIYSRWKAANTSNE